MAERTLDDLLKQGWGDHEAKTAEVADRLEAGVELVIDGDGAARFAALANHCVGDHGGDRARALNLVRAAVDRAGDDAGPPALIQLAVACHLGEDTAGATAAEQQAGGTPAVAARLKLLVASGHMHAGNWDLAGPLYTEGINAAYALIAGNDAERAGAIVSNNVASALLDLEPRTDAQTALMVHAAEASRDFWLRIGDWMNDERADFLLSLVHTAAGQPEAGRTFAERGLQTIAEHGEEQVDEAFLHLARARAAKAQGDAAVQAESLAVADGLASAFNEGLKRWFDGERAKSAS